MVENSGRLSLDCNDRKPSSGGRANDWREQSNLAYEADETSDVVGTLPKQQNTAVYIIWDYA